jgi:peptidyl-prolyl cis-trans isomerase B (cyclophilin B)
MGRLNFWLARSLTTPTGVALVLGCAVLALPGSIVVPGPMALAASVHRIHAAAPTDTRPCVYIPTPPQWGPTKYVGMPPNLAPTTPADVMTIVTNRGKLRVAMLTSAAPCTVNSFRFLSSQKYFDGTSCHRLTTSGIFVLQCGDPSGTGSGGPGYMYQDENLAGATYGAGTVAMANAGPSTNGSQFFITYKDSSLPPLYTPFGSVLDDGLKIIKAVAAGGSDNSNASGDGHPKRPLVIDQLTVVPG